VSASTVGIILSVFSLAVAAAIIWGAFAEEKRGNADSASALNKN
jgi:cbb3-type cytochrome oxidase subunit 3